MKKTSDSYDFGREFRGYWRDAALVAPVVAAFMVMFNGIPTGYGFARFAMFSTLLMGVFGVKTIRFSREVRALERELKKREEAEANAKNPGGSPRKV